MKSQLRSVLGYEGPGERLVRLNLFLAGAAIFPAVLEGVIILSSFVGRFIDIANLPGLIAGLLLAGVAENPIVLVFPILIGTILIPSLWRDPEIPSSVRRGTVMIVMAAFGVMLLHAVVLSMEHRHGRFRGLFL